MSSRPFKVYTRSMIKKFDYYANWLPGVPRRLGDIGVFEGSSFRQIGNLEDLDIGFEIRPDDSPTDIEHTSEKGVDISLGAGAGGNVGVGSGNASLSFKFSATGAFVFEAKNVRYPSIKNLIKLQQDINQHLTTGSWRPEWRVVTEIAEAERGAVLISGSREAEFAVEANAEALEASDLTNAGLNFRVTRKKDMHTNIVGQEKMTPMFRVHGLKRRGGALVTRGRPRIQDADADNFAFTEFTGLELVVEDEES